MFLHNKKNNSLTISQLDMPEISNLYYLTINLADYKNDSTYFSSYFWPNNQVCVCVWV